MSQSDPRADAPLLNWGELGMSELLPTGTVTLLLADVEGSTQLWDRQPEEMAAAIALLDRVLADVVAAHGGVRPIEQGEGDSFVVAFARSSDAVACALQLQRAPLVPIRLRIGVHTGEVQLRDEGNYIGPTINRTARLRELAHGGQTLLSGTTEDLVVDTLPAGAWLVDLGSHRLRDLPRPERVVQLCHADLRNDFPPLRTPSTAVSQNLPVQLTSFVGREAEIADLRRILANNRLVTLTGAGGAGKTRLAVQVATLMAGEIEGGVWYVDLAPITDPDLVPATVARALGLLDQPGRSTMDLLLRFLSDRRALVVLDNCEHLLDASAALMVALLEAGPGLTLLATSREPVGIAGEVSWRVPSLSLSGEAVELFADRARRVRPDFAITADNAAAVTEICRRLDGMPLAIELAAARVRALSLAEIVAGLHDSFHLLTGGARTAVRRQQTLRASVDWSHALLTEPERVLFRRLAVFLGGFDLDAAQAVAGAGQVKPYQVLDQVILLVDKSLVVAENTSGRTRYRLLETVRQYAFEKLRESGEAEDVRSRHRDHYLDMAAVLDAPARSGHEQRVEPVEAEMDNLRSAFGWSLETDDVGPALQLASSLQPLWLSRGRIREGLAWLETGIADQNAHELNVAPAVRVRALADKALLLSWVGSAGIDEAEQALTMARELDDPALLIRALIARGAITAYDAQVSRPYFAEAARLARELGDAWRLSQILRFETAAAMAAGDPVAVGVAAEEGLQVAEAVGDRDTSRQCRWAKGWARTFQGDMAGALPLFRDVINEATAEHDAVIRLFCLVVQGFTMAYLGDSSGARASGDAALETSADLIEYLEGPGYATVAFASLAAGDAAAAQQAFETARQRTGMDPQTVGLYTWSALAPLACGDLTTARRWADDVVSATKTKGCYLERALTTRARVAIAQGEMDEAERDARDALSSVGDTGTLLGLSATLECLADIAADTGSHHEAARLLGAAYAIRQRTGEVRFKVLDADYEASVRELRNAMGDRDFSHGWAEGSALSPDDAIAYAQRGRGERMRASSGWASLTPAELDVVRLVSEGLANKDIATRLFVSPRTVQSHLTHVYAKLGLTSRLQLAQEAARHV